MKESTKWRTGLDQKSERLLAALQSNGELSLAEIGKMLGLSKMAVSNRIRRLKGAGILEGSHYKVNPQKVGQEYLVVSQASCEASGPEQQKIAAQIARIPGVQSVYLTFGPFDILFIARRRDMKSARDLLYDVTRIQGIRNTQTTIPHTVIKETLDISLEA
ncbi:MAG: Lrp/AsnC family transcriptional regulator [Thaumarchaeota archaeon]|nr:Lrp/AsnC family transcriptional regulator [Nitrososphaerota archaeon]